jgi:hypothetical protein
VRSQPVFLILYYELVSLISACEAATDQHLYEVDSEAFLEDLQGD